MKKKKSRVVLAVVIIILIILSVAIWALIDQFLKARAQSLWMACQSNLRNIGYALEMYAEDNKGQYPDSLEKIEKSIDACPAAGKDTYSNSYVSSKNPAAFTVYCSGSFHTKLQEVGPNYPQYTSRDGLIPR